MEHLKNALNNIKTVIANARMTKNEHIELEANIKYIEDLAVKELSREPEPVKE